MPKFAISTIATARLFFFSGVPFAGFGIFLRHKTDKYKSDGRRESTSARYASDGFGGGGATIEICLEKVHRIDWIVSAVVF